MWSGHIAWSLVVLTCQDQNESEDQATGQGSPPQGPGCKSCYQEPALARILPCLLTRLVELKRLPSELLHQRQGLASSLACREETKENLPSGHSSHIQLRKAPVGTNILQPEQNQAGPSSPNPRDKRYTVRLLRPVSG